MKKKPEVVREIDKKYIRRAQSDMADVTTQYFNNEQRELITKAQQALDALVQSFDAGQ